MATSDQPGGGEGGGREVDPRLLRPLTPEEETRKRRRRMRGRVRGEWRGWGREVSSTRNVGLAADCLEEILGGLSLDEGIEEERLKEAWGEVAGSFIAGHTRPVSLVGGVLRLQVLQPAMRFHLEQEKGRILERIQKELGRKRVRQVSFVLG